MQAQDYAGALWAVGLRCSPDATAADVETAIAERRIVRTWPMRGTLHLVPPEDVRWMLALLAPRQMARAEGRHAQLGLTAADFARAGAIFADALAGGRAFTRAEAMALLESGGIPTAGQRGYHVLWMLAQQGVLCCGPMRGRQQTFVLLDEWVPPGGEPSFGPGEALARLAGNYLAGHGPATVADFAWWAGITKTEARAGMAAIAGDLECIRIDEAEYQLPRGVSAVPRRGPASPVHLLPGFDEYMLGYTDRSLQLGEHRQTYSSTVSANGMFSPTLVVDGRIAGTWKRAVKKDRVEIALSVFRALDDAGREGLAEAADRYGRFLGLPAVVKG
jgi:hypothetical protein